MAQRLNKKLLLGLGSTLGFLGTGVVSGFGINAIVNNASNFSQDQLALNTLPEADFKTASDYNVATSDMFINTTDLKRFHFGNTQKGQTITPYGWLGVFEEGNQDIIKNRIALTGWNGEILWVNEDYKGQQTADYNVYEMKYDFNTNLIFVLRSGSQNGLVNDTPGSLQLTKVQLDILDATTGQRIASGGEAINANEFSNFQSQALNVIQSNFLNIQNLGGKKPITNLFQLDVVSISNNKVLVTWMPNFMLLKDLGFQTFPRFRNVVDFFGRLTKSFVFEKINPTTVRKNIKNFNLRGNSSEFSTSNLSPNWFRFWENGGNIVNLNDYSLLTNPFFTTVNGDKLILHLIVAKSRNIESNKNIEITHKIVGFSENNGGHLGFDYDKSEQIGGTQLGDSSSYLNLLNVDSKLNRDTAAWSRANTFGADFINANLRINRNMFDGNSVVFAYPYAAQTNSTNNFPIFNVAQLQIDQSSGLLFKNNSTNNKKRNTNWDFGKQIVDYYERNGNRYNGSNFNKVYPYPNTNAKLRKLNHNYHRLISVNPFDNTFLYAGKSNLTDQALEQDDVNVRKYASFWISRNDKFVNNKGLARPLIVGNDVSLNSFASSYMTDIFEDGFEGLYNDGFTFDPRSQETVSGGKKSLQLYFNQTGTGRNENKYTPNNGFRTSKIGLLNDVLNKASSSDNNGTNLWVDNIANVSKINNKNLLITGIDLDSYSTLIHSRANLTTWYSRTFWNNTNPGNSLAGNDLLNESTSSDSRAIATNFDRRLSSAEFDSKKAVDLVSAWKDKADNQSKNPPNYNRLFVKRPQIKVRNLSVENQLPTETTYPLTSSDFLNSWLPRNLIDRFVFKKEENITNASYEILTTFGKTNNNIVLNNIGDTTKNINLGYESSSNRLAAWFDKRLRPNNPGGFGSWNNNVIIDGKAPLRLLAKIVKPLNNLPTWFNKIDPKIFANAYPVESPAQGETTFQSVLTELARQKASNLEIQGSENSAVGLANLKIEVYLGLNPNFVNGNTIYTNGANTNNKIIIDHDTGQRIIYYDRYNNSKRTIYDQSQINYASFRSGGFNASSVINSALWKNGIIKQGKRLFVSTDYSLLPDKIVRKTPGSRDPLFQFDYQLGTRNLEIRPVDVTWFKSLLQNLNRMTNLYAGFQYKTATNNRWTDHILKTNDNSITGGNRKFLYDNEWIFNNNKLVFSNFPASDVTKLRIKLWTKDGNEIQKDGNFFVDYQNLDISNDIDKDDLNPLDKFISVSHNISSQKIAVDKNWFKNVRLSNDSLALDQLNANDIKKYEDQIFNQSKILVQNNELRQKVKLIYEFEGEKNLNEQELQTAIQNKLKNYKSDEQGIFTLFNGIKGLAIKATFAPTINDGSVEFVTINNRPATQNDLSGEILSDLITNINLTSYIEQLQTNKITARKGNAVGQLTSFDIPSKNGAPGTGQLNGKSFDNIKTILANVGISIRYKKWDNASKKWSPWLVNQESVNSYNPADPRIVIGFKIENNYNVKLLVGDNVINDDSQFELELLIPKLVVSDQQAIEKFKTSAPIQGNTYKIDVTNTANNELILKQAIKDYNNRLIGPNNNEFNNLVNQLEIQYALGANNDFKNAAEFKQSLLDQKPTNHQNNQIRFKMILKPTTADPEFELDDTLKQIIVLYPNENQIIKKYIHGEVLESELKKIKPSGSLNNINYIVPSEIQKIIQNQTPGLKIQYTFNSQLAVSSNGTAKPDTDPKLEWKDLENDQLPSVIEPGIESIFLQIVNKELTKYVYGPDDQQNKEKARIDLSQLITPIIVNSQWFNQNKIIEQISDLNVILNKTIFNEYENKIWKLAKIEKTSPLRNKVKLTYQFNNNNDLSIDDLFVKINQFRQDYRADHLGILQLWDGTQNHNGMKIFAKFATVVNNDPTIKFVDNKGIENNDLVGAINTNGIKTTIDLQNYVNVLQNQRTSVQTNGTIGTIRSFTPPPMNTNNGFLAGKNYEQISNRLNQLGIQILFRQTGTNNNQWISKTAVTKYNPSKPILDLSFSNASTNIKLNLKPGLIIDSNGNNQQEPITLTLNAPKEILIDNNIIDEFKNDSGIEGDTKNITFNNNKITTLIEKIKQFNVVNSGNNSDFQNAPLRVVFRLGDDTEYREIQQWKSFLNQQNQDQTKNNVDFKFIINEQQQNDWFVRDTSYQLFANQINENANLPIYINDNNLYQTLQSAVQNNSILSGTNQDLIWTWPSLINIDEQTNEIVRAPGKGLKIQFSFEKNPDPNNPDHWSDQRPKSFNPNTQQKLWIHLITKAGYVYEKNFDNTNNKLALDLTKIKEIINVDATWLNKKLSVVHSSGDINNLVLTDIENYEKLVLQEIPSLSSENKQKLQIKYFFDQDLQNAINKNELLKLIKDYSKNKNNNDLGILQLWNQYKGKKIHATFVKANETGNYQLVYPENQSEKALVDTTEIKTTIDLKPIVNWLKNIQVPVETGQKPNEIVALKIPIINLANNDQNNVFHNQSWTTLEKVLKNLAVQVQYRNHLNNTNSNWGNNQSNVTKYDNQGQFEIRFEIIANQGQNIRLIIDDQNTINGAGQSVVSEAIIVNLKVVKNIDLKQNIIQQFIQTSNVVSGNTKNLRIDQTAVKSMVDQILQANASENPAAKPSFTEAPLVVRYKMAEDSNWLNYNDFLQHLQDRTQDYQSNQIEFKFFIEQQQNKDPEFAVPDTNKFILFNHSDASANPLIKYYINPANYETQANGFALTGTNKVLNWNWNGLTVIEEQSETLIYINNRKVGLRVEFTTKENTTYNDPLGTNLINGWTKEQPRNLPADVNNLYVRLKPLTGYVYGANNPVVHKVNLNVLIRLIEVREQWLNEKLINDQPGQKFLINSLAANHFDNYENQVLANFSSNNLKNKVELKFQLNNNNDPNSPWLSKNEIASKLKELLNFNNQSSNGIVQLWNKSIGWKINVAFFVKQNIGSNYQIYNSDNNKQESPIKTLDTSNIYTKIDLQAALVELQKLRIPVNFVGANADRIQIIMPNFPTGNWVLSNLKWINVTQELKNHGIKIQYRSSLPNSNWVDDLKAITNYAQEKGTFELRFVLNADQGKNILLSVNSESDVTTANLESKPITLFLQVPLKIVINEAFVRAFIENGTTLDGNTKFLKINNEKQMLKAIIDENVSKNSDFEKIRDQLEVLYAIGQNPASFAPDKWKPQAEFLQELEDNDQDQLSNQINFKFNLKNQASNADFIIDEQIFQLNSHEDPNASQSIKLPYYINGLEWESLAKRITVSGKNSALKWDYNALPISKENQKTIIIIPSTKFKGLQIEYTSKLNPTYEESANPNGNLANDWILNEPVSLPLGTENLFIRLKATNNNFVYETSASIHQVNLNLIWQLIVDKAWIEQTNFASNINFVDEISETAISNFVNDVINHFTQNQFKDKLDLRFSFNQENNLSATTLFQKISVYLRNYNNPTKGILQLFNTDANSGEIIKAQFVSKEPNKYEIVSSDLDNDLSKISAAINTNHLKTKIDFKKYVDLLKQKALKVEIDPVNSNQLNKVVLPDFNNQTTPVNFQNQSWNDVETILTNLGIELQAAAFLNENFVPNEKDWKNWKNVKTFNPKIGKMKFRFKLINSKATNIVLSIINDNDLQWNNQTAPVFDVDLDVPLQINLDSSFLAEFVNSNPISGNTKYLTINQNAENQLINKIIAQNEKINAKFAQAASLLKIEYALGNGNQNGIIWQERADFVNSLKTKQTDQTTNQIIYRFIIKENNGINSDQSFEVDNNARELLPEQIGNSAAKVKIYLHERNLENLLDQVVISGTNNKFNYIWPANLQAILAINGLKLQYSTKIGIQNEFYNSTTANQDSKIGWTNNQVNSIDPKERFLALQVVALDGYVYGAEFAKNNPDLDPTTTRWKVHVVDVKQIKSEIKLSSQGLNKIIFDAQLPEINVSAIKKLEMQAIQAANFDEPLLQDKVKIEYQLIWDSKFSPDWMNLEELETSIQTYMNDFNNTTVGLLKFNKLGLTTAFATIKARFVSNDEKYLVIDKDLPNTEIQNGFSAVKILKTDKLQSLINLKSYVKILQEQFVILPITAPSGNISGFKPPAFPNRPNEQFANKTFDQISAYLEQIGIIIEFKAPDDNNGRNDWVLINQITTLNKKNELFIRFRVKTENFQDDVIKKGWADSFAILTTTDQPESLTNQNNFATNAIKLKIDLPILINVNKNELNQEQLKLRGNTWQIQNADAILGRTKELIQQAKNNNNTAATNVNQANLKIQFKFPGLKTNNQKEWFEIKDLEAALLAQTDKNWNTNEIQVRWWIDENEKDSNGFRYKISDSDPFILQTKNLDSNAILKIYIHKKDVYSLNKNIYDNLKPTGTTEEYVINGLTKWTEILQREEVEGLEIQFSNQSQPNLDNHWTTYLQNDDLPKPLNPDKDLWFRYQVKPGYEYGDALANDSKHSEKIKLDTNGIKLILELSTAWLEQIKLFGNLKNLKIDEENAKQMMIASGKLPTNQSDLIIFEYSFDNQNWKTANEFQILLQQQNGKKDETNFIIKRDDIKVRFSWQSTNINIDQYQMKIDNELITNDNRSNYNVNLISNTLNTIVKGYIELENFKYFVLSNFAIQGTNAQPKLIINNRQLMENLMQNYATDNLFDIVITTKKSANGNWDWTNKKSILQRNNTFIDSNRGLIDLGVVLDGNKQVALRFESKNQNYDVYQHGTLHQEGYVLDISQNVKVTVEIINPFTRNNKSLGLWWTLDNDRQQGKYYQGQGGFKIVVADKQGNIDSNNFISAITWLSNNSGLTQNEINALEFVYHIFEPGTTPTTAEIEKISNPNLINNYTDPTWQKLSDVLENNAANGEYFTKSLGLKVGQYVSVALRVKEKYATGQNIFVLKDQDQSFLAPILQDGTTPGRAHGFLIKAPEIKLAQNSIVLENILNFNDAPLDGYTRIKSLNLEKDPNDQYLGVDLNLKLYHEFYERNGQILLTPEKIKLVKRDEKTAVGNHGNFKNVNGSDILDQNNQPIKILLDANNKPTKPIEQTKATLEELLTNYQDGHFGFNIPENKKDYWGIFRNEKVILEVKAIAGKGQAIDPDFILEGTNEIEIKDLISPQIKFPILNPNNIQYKFNQDDFSRTKIKYKHASKPAELAPIDGSSMVETLVELTKIKSNGTSEIIKGNNIEQTLKNLTDEIQASFFNQLQFQTVYEPKTGGNQIVNQLNLYNLKSLSNGDRIKVQIVAADNDFLWSQAPQPLTINVAGLTAKAPRKEQLRFLRVDQGGKVNGQGSFKVLVNNPEDANSDVKEILQGWKFVIRVWDSERKIKHDWTAEQERINDLKNGDKVEWKLLDEFNNPVEDPYYNTVAGKHEQNASTGQTIFKFNQMHYPNGLTSGTIFKEGIGQYPNNDEEYPIDSGFVISGLEDVLQTFELNNDVFAKIINQLEPHYVGFNGQGTINFKEDYLNKNYYINARGELYEKSLNQPSFKQQIADDVAEISLADFLANTTFYTSDPSLINYQNGFKFLGNDTNLNNNLSNGDRIWAQFDLQVDNNEVNRGISTELNPVTGLKDLVTDPMTPLWYILMAIGGAITLGGLSLFILWFKRNRKLKK